MATKTRAGRAGPPSSSMVVTRLESVVWWPTTLAVTVGVGVVLFAGLRIWGQGLSLQSLVVVVTLLASAGIVKVGRVHASRAQLRDRLVEALAQATLNRHLDRRAVILKDWAGGPSSFPRTVKVRYSAEVTGDRDPVWGQMIKDLVETRVGADYKVEQHQLRRTRLILSLAHTVDEPTQQKVARVRAEHAAGELLGATARVTDVTFSGDAISSISVIHSAGVKLSAAGYRARVEQVVSTIFPGRWRAVWDLENDTVQFELRPSLPRSVWLPTSVPPNVDDLLSNYRSVEIGLAIDEDGNEITWRPAVVPQAIITGGTGTGKTSTGHGILGKITQYGWPVWVSDPKRVEFLDFRDWPNVQIVAGTVPQQVAMIHQAWVLMEHRYQLIEEGRARVEDFEPLVVFLDEFAEFRANLLNWYVTIKQKGDPSKPLTLDEVASLARKARTARIHIVLFTQRPDAEFLGGEMRDNFGLRISMGRLSPQGAMMMWEDPSVGVSLPRKVTGRAMAVDANENPVEVQTYRFPSFDSSDPEEIALLKELRPAKSVHPRLLYVPQQSSFDVDKAGEQVEVAASFTEIATARWVKASEHPDLDPLVQAEFASDVDRRELSSAMTSLGLSGMSRTPRTTPAAVLAPEASEEPGFDDYEDPAPASASTLEVGDLIEVEEGSGVWVVVHEPVSEDMSEDGQVYISWRSDEDEFGVLSVEAEGFLSIRRPKLEAFVVNYETEES